MHYTHAKSRRKNGSQVLCFGSSKIALKKFLQLDLIIIIFCVYIHKNFYILENKILSLEHTQSKPAWHHHHRHLTLNLNFFPLHIHTHIGQIQWKHDEEEKAFSCCVLQLFGSREGTVKRLKWKNCLEVRKFCGAKFCQSYGKFSVMEKSLVLTTKYQQIKFKESR